jgi:hypothetical protein
MLNPNQRQTKTSVSLLPPISSAGRLRINAMHAQAIESAMPQQAAKAHREQFR